MSPLEVYQTYLAFKNHFTKDNYDYFKYCGKTKASKTAFNNRKDRYFFERMSRKKSDDEIQRFFLANFSQSQDPSRLWIGEMIDSGEKVYVDWLKKIQSLQYLFKTEAEVFVDKKNFDKIFSVSGGSHSVILKKYLQGAISLETLVLLDMILGFSKNHDKNLFDPVWETVSLKIKKYKPFLNIDIKSYKNVLREIVCE